ncbi:hypothetical protein DY000_02031722 [Brassica cretica]|uniref:Uncharacterized protein n=1 Tax=Brassica cretica TaxID=69181 RepID=A0ABQ7DIT8_BRACR|nr:hypothetical protein DY000_02031722 [Brassica cretica]
MGQDYSYSQPSSSSNSVDITSLLEAEEEEAVGEPEGRPLGVKAAKAALKKKKSGREQELSKLQGVLELKVKAEVVTGALKLGKVTGAFGVGKVTGALGVLKVTGSSLSVYVV